MGKAESAKADDANQDRTSIQAGESPVHTPAPVKIQPLYWIRNGVQVVKDGKPIVSDSDINAACVSGDGKLVAYAKGHTQIVVVNLSTGKRTGVYSASGKTTVKYKDSGSERDVAFPVGFSADNKRLYLINQASSVFVGGNKLLSVSTSGGPAKVEDVGVSATAVSRSGDILILKPGLVQFNGRKGDTWEVAPKYRSIFVNGVGFTAEGKPFYYSSDGIVVVDGHGGDVEISVNSANFSSTPVVVGNVVVWDDGKRVVSNEGGSVKSIGGMGSNRQPFK